MVVEITESKLTVCPASRVSVEGVGDEVGPLFTVGSTLLPRLIVPVKPPMLWTLMTETASTPGFTHKLDGVDVRRKSVVWAWTTGPRANAPAMIMMGIARLAGIRR